MTGLQMMLKAAGFDPAAIMEQIDTVKVELPLFAQHIKAKVDSMESRIDSMEVSLTLLNNKLDRIMEHMEIEPAESTNSLVVISGT